MLIVQFTNILIFDYTYFIYRHLLMTYIKYLWKEKSPGNVPYTATAYFNAPIISVTEAQP